jgi:hypothetical protein
MAGVLLRTSGGTLLFTAYLWLVSVDDYRVAGMLLTFPMLNGIGIASAGANAERLTKSMMPVITLNGLMCFLFVLALIGWEPARLHPIPTTAAAALAWLCVYVVLEKRNIAFARMGALAAFVATCAVASAGITYWLWPSCTFQAPPAELRAGGLAGIAEGWMMIALFAASLAILFGFAHRYRHKHTAIGRLAALPLVPLFGLYTAAAALGADAAALAKLESLRSMILVGWVLAMVFVVVLARLVVRMAVAGRLTLAALLVAGWALCIGMIVGSAKLAAALSGCTQARLGPYLSFASAASPVRATCIGSIALPSRRTSKCRCGSALSPVVPTLPIDARAATQSPFPTSMRESCE